jgi:hypothetical protein
MRMPRPQFSLKSLLWLMVVVAAFFAGIQFERDRRRRELEKVSWPILSGLKTADGRAIEE